jgi:hypothetical protein
MPNRHVLRQILGAGNGGMGALETMPLRKDMRRRAGRGGVAGG